MVKSFKNLMMVLFLAASSLLTSCVEERANDQEKAPVLEDYRDNKVEKLNTIIDINGKEVTYDMNTNDIVALGCAGDLLAMGIRPLAVDGNANTTGYEDFYKGVEILKNTQPFDPQEVLSYHPKLILTYDTMDEKDLNTLGKLKVPVIPIYFSTYDYEKRLNYIGEIFGLEKNAEALISYYKDLEDKSLKELEEMGQEDKSLTIFTYYQGITIPPDYNGAFVFNHILYDVLGFKKIKKVEDFLNDQHSQAYATISNEVIKDYEGDIVLFATMGDELVIPDVVLTNVGWQALKAQKENRIGVNNMLLYSFKDVLYMDAQYDQLISALKISLK